MKNIIKIASGILFLICLQSNAQETVQPESKETPVIVIQSAEITTAVLGAEETEEIIENNKKIEMTKPNLYSIKVIDIDGKEFNFGDLKGKKILIVNTASKCGYTPQYSELEELYKKMKNNNLVIVGFPSNDFGQQEQGSNAEIKSFCTNDFGVTFPMMSKVSVSGNDKCELYQFLTQKDKNGVEDSKVEWNFQKYLINENGQLEKVFSPKVTPMSEEILVSLKKRQEQYRGHDFRD